MTVMLRVNVDVHVGVHSVGGVHVAEQAEDLQDDLETDEGAAHDG